MPGIKILTASPMSYGGSLRRQTIAQLPHRTAKRRKQAPTFFNLLFECRTSPSSVTLVLLRLTVLFLDIDRRSTPSSVPAIQAVKTITKRGVIEVKNSTGDSLGYISKNSLSKAQLQCEPAIDNATTVTFVIQESSISASQVRITMEDSDEIGFPLLGLVQGANDTSVDIGSGSYLCRRVFLYLTGIAHPESVAGAVPANISNAYTNATTLEQQSPMLHFTENVVLTSRPTYSSQLDVHAEHIKLPKYTTMRDVERQIPTVVQFWYGVTLIA
ncbi:uncharacterized protein LACBIDRAFT_329933 [Laccaria bicolor S238N-H82]|uniref:Predicted protein n=1 Tax=Laccaria bicolor (strain S238N-H82 / ATCC MYA-4686) TaxID=486041 RepID=B0DJM7_LACBS|nr:uncharacterized protein LACBIDRAFT_329933 [Laccaria bicolor S238N-H82]EDR05145.1 predicted protein [Laccaria bicolor S238N-H82]|eukprot:XP_001884110.1 predicted protein [Laccaria bicolor S238N-H82]